MGQTHQMSVDTSASPPRPHLADEVRDRILHELLLSGAISPGELMPTEAELCHRYGASRVTVRAALRSLKEAGFIAIRQGRGSTVLPQPHAIYSGLDRLSSLETFAANQGAVVSSEQLEIFERELSDDEADRMECPLNSRALIIRRVKVYDADKVGWIEDLVPEGVMSFETIREEFDGSVLDVLLAHRELQVEYSNCDLTATGLPADIAEHLGVDEGVPGLYLDELTRTATGEIVNWSLAWLLPQYFNFGVRRRRT